MLNLPPIIARIRELLKKDDQASTTYAALEARLAIEKVCYDRLRQRHDYISHKQLQRWQPGAVVNTLLADVDEHAAETVILSISRTPADEGVPIKQQEYVEVGREIGFDHKRMSSLWNALGNLALHVALPRAKDDYLPEYGETDAIRSKVLEVIAVLAPLATSTMAWSGFGRTVSFICDCGEPNWRRAKLLRAGQVIHCINPSCKFTHKVFKDEEDICFQPVTISVACDVCQTENVMPLRALHEMKPEQAGSFACRSCGHLNEIRWRLMHAHRK